MPEILIPASQLQLAKCEMPQTNQPDLPNAARISPHFPFLRLGQPTLKPKSRSHMHTQSV